MERMERVNSNFDLEYDYYRKNLPALDDSKDTEESMNLYEQIFESRKTFTVLGLDSYIIIDKKSLNRIASMIDSAPQEYVLFTNHQIIDEDKFDKLVKNEKDLKPIFIPEPDEEENINDIDEDGFKKAENIDLEIINIEIFTRCLWLYLALVVCACWDFIFFLYILAKTEYGFNSYSIYTVILFGILLFTGIYGFLKCRWRDFSGYVLKGLTLGVPFFVLIGVIIYFSISMTLKGFWIKLVIDLISFVMGFILILFLFGLIKIKYDDDTEIKEGLLNTEKQEAPIYKF